MPNEKPYREYCANRPPPDCGHGQLFKHKRATDAAIHKFGNTVTVPNPAGGPDIPPYERWTPDFSGGLSCETHHCITGAGAAPCSAWEQPFPTQVFTDTGDKVDLTVCHKRGFKNVQAARSWHGAHGWTSNQVICPVAYCADGTPVHGSLAGAPDQTKYLGVTYNVHFNLLEDEGAHNTTDADKTGSRSVNAISGETTSSLITTETQKGDPGDGSLVISYYTSGGAGYNQDIIFLTTTPFAKGGTTVLDTLDNDLHCGFPLVVADNPSRGDLVGFIATWNAGLVDDPSVFTGGTLPLVTDANNYTGTATGSSNLGATLWSADLTFSRTATTVTWDFKFIKTFTGDSRTMNSHYYGSITLSSPHTAASVKADLVTNLLALWPLNDDLLYPFRTDRKVSVAPYVARNERDNAAPIAFNTYTVDDLTAPINDASGNAPFSGSWTPTYTQRAWFDDTVYTWLPIGLDPATTAATGLQLVYDGSIFGGPKPAGNQNYFDFGFLDIRGCCYRPPASPGSQTWSWYQVGWGQTVATFNSFSGCALPLNCTHWTNWFQAINKPPGAWMFYADPADYFGTGCFSSSGHSLAGDAGKFVAQKWLEALDPWPSQNFALPAGDMKFWFDETLVTCATNVSGSGEGSQWLLTDQLSGTPPGTVEPDYIWGGPVVGGFYNISGYTPGIVTLGSKVYDVPTNWVSKSDVGSVTVGAGDPHTDADFCFGPLRWPDAPSLLGRIPVTTSGAGTDFVFTAEQPSFGMNASTHQEQVDLYDAGMALLASNVAAVRDTNTTFHLTGTGRPTAVWVQIHGSAPWYVNDASPKGDFAYTDWTSDFRSFGEYARLTGLLDCAGVQVARPTANAGGGPIDVTTQFAAFNQTPGCLPFVSCAPKVVCISPNAEKFINGATYDFPGEFLFDELYGSKWWGYVHPTMTNIYWQPPHRPCNIDNTCAKWTEDVGTCAANVDTDCGGETPPEYFYALEPLVEARLTVPPNYGLAQNESAPALPTGIQIGWLSPVTNTTGDVALPPTPAGASGDDGNPNAVATAWDLHAAMCATSAFCRFDYTLPGC